MLAVAIDLQGADRARPFVEQAHATYPNAVDPDNRLAEAFGFRAVPNAVFVDEAGIIRYIKFGGFDIRIPADRVLADRFVESPNLDELQRLSERGYAFEHEEALAYYREGLSLYKDGKVKAALASWRKSVALTPENWILRKQVWAIENPEKFYNGMVDFDWQKEQIAKKQ